MESNSKLKVFMASTAVALACAGAAYRYLKHRYKDLNYLTIKSVTNEKLCDEVVSELRRSIIFHRTLGFDCEWVSEHGKRHPVALVQLSSFDGLCGLFKLSQLGSMPKSLKDLLEDASIYKVGVAPLDDAAYLLHDYSVNMQSCLDIRHLVQLCGYSPGGLGALAKSLLNVTMDKSWRIRSSNWEALEYTDRQVRYAATDAHVAVKMFVNLVNEHSGVRLAWLFRSRSASVWKNLDELCSKYTGVHFTTKMLKEGGEKNKKTKEVKEVTSKPTFRYPHATRSKPLYHNCFLEAPDGELLCTIDNKKANWYVDKQLADVVTASPVRVRLRFEPAGRSVGDVGRYYQLTKRNQCVVCGGARSYIRKNVVPREYRKYFPEIMKDHSSHDVVLLCALCHKTSNVRDQAVRELLARVCAAPLCGPSSLAKYTEDAECKKIRSAARALLSSKHVLPDARRGELEDVLLQHYTEETEVTQELLQQAAVIQVVFENSDYECHGAKVVEHYLQQDGGLLTLEQLWREHFLLSMAPRYLPELWSLTHNEQRLRVKFNEGRLTEEDLKSVGLKWSK